MPYYSKASLKMWLVDFDAGGPGLGRAYVADDTALDGRDEGLVVYPLSTSTISLHIQPTAPGSLDWRITIDAYPHDTTLSAPRLREMCQELSAAAILCDYLQERAFAHDETAGPTPERF